MEAILYSCVRKESDTLSVLLSLPRLLIALCKTRRLQTYLIEILIATSNHVCPSDRDPKNVPEGEDRITQSTFSSNEEWHFSRRQKKVKFKRLYNLKLIWTGQIRKAASKFRVILVKPKGNIYWLTVTVSIWRVSTLFVLLLFILLFSYYLKFVQLKRHYFFLI